MSSVTNAGSSSCLAADIHPLIATICLCACVFVCATCVHGHDKMGVGLLKRFVKANMSMSFSVRLRVGECFPVHVWDLCPLRSKVSLLVTGYSNVSPCWVLMDCVLNRAMWTLKPNSFECITGMPPHTVHQATNGPNCRAKILKRKVTKGRAKTC